MTEIIGTTLGHCRITAKIGEGGMGVVYRAHDERLDRDVAIKVLPASVARDPDRISRFEREARAVAKLDHPNILAIHDFGVEQGVTYAVMELLEGQSLREVISDGGLTTSKVVEYAGLIASGLAAAHDKGIVHRDLKPENVFLTRDGRIKILDFGLAKLTEIDQRTGNSSESATQALPTQPGAVVGTIGYMAPEQLRGKPADSRTDIFALGCVMYEMLTGNRAFAGDTAHEVGAAILQQDPLPLSETGTGLERVVRRCLEKRPEDRFQSARDLGFALEATVGSSPAAPSSDVKRRFRLGHALAVVFGAIIAALVVLPPEGLWQRLSSHSDVVGPIRSIAVLPLENLSSDPEQEYFSDGMTEALITKLAQIGSLDVISRTSVMLYKNSQKPLPQIALELGVDAVVEGSVTRGENNVRIAVQLIHGATDRHLWAEEYQRPLRDILVLQGEVARAVAEEINAALSTEEEDRLLDEHQVDPDAHEAYLKGMHSFLQFTGDGLIKSIEYFEHAIELDPGYADPYAGLAAAHLNSTYFMGLAPTEVVPQARTALKKALEIDPNNAGAVLSAAWIEMTYDWDWAAAERSHLRALELEPSSSYVHGNYSYMLAAAGRFDEALDHARRAERLDPLSLFAGQQVGMMLYLARRYDESIAQLERTKELNPYFWFAYQRMAQALLATGDYQRGIETMQRGIELAGPDTVRSGEHTLASLYARSGRRQGAVEILEELEEQAKSSYIPPSDLAQIYTALGSNDEAFEWLERAVEVRDADLFMARVSPVWDPLRDDPRFDALLRRLNLSAE